MNTPPTLRCAVYTRKSSEEGLEREFNSLQAQRVACEAYILSQAGEGWVCLPDASDDGGISGGTMERPGLKQLLADIIARRVDVVVVYKVDRLTRSLGDFGRMVEIFDKHGVSFVSITQAFNTTSSMGRLTLNVLLSFAQFEREVTGERIRDKIAASKKRGMWMGGIPPFGYDADGRTLKINEAEAATVRLIFEQYLQERSVHRLIPVFKAQGLLTRRTVYSTGRVRGGRAWDRGALFWLLANPVYIGKIRHKEELFDGQHPPIIDAGTFARVQALLKLNSVRRDAGSARRMSSSLMGKLFDEAGEPMTPTFTTRPGGRSYRYYVSAAAQRGQRGEGIQRIPAVSLEQLVADLGGRLLVEASATLERVMIVRSGLELTLRATEDRDDLIELIRPGLLEGERIRPGAEGAVIVFTPVRPVFRGGAKTLIGVTATAPRTRPDPVLLAGLRRGHALLKSGGVFDPGRTEGKAPRHDRRLCRLAFLAPDIQADIVEGRLSRSITLSGLIAMDLPLSWAAQRRLLSQESR